MNSIMAVFFFELKRIMTRGRAFWWGVVATFPVAIMLLMKKYVDFGPQEAAPPQTISTVFTIVLYFVAPTISCMLGALLTAAPAVASELEQHSWIYLAVRPNGLFHLIVGKYLVAVMWTASATVTGVIIAVSLAAVDGPADVTAAVEQQQRSNSTDAAEMVPGIIDKGQVTQAMVCLSLLSACAYSALYMMLGTVFNRRAMVLCVAYTAAVELFLGFFPAVINRFTIQYRLRSLLFEWTPQSEQFRRLDLVDLVASDESAFTQIMWLMSWIALFLAIALVSVQVREFTSASETDV
ncbi:MAG: hypothetical protein GY758_00325 [Fuerstiella sp.]|nr:hypothetical protein [Fuerstiella sp.]MCP4511742.1 hypothetical protein [Fuerstiella sp.]